MGVETYEYPASGAPTNTFAPTIDARPDGSGETVADGVVGDQSAGNKQYRYAEGVVVQSIARRYEKNSDADRTSFKAFKTAVGGDTFKFTDYLAAAHTVAFEPGEIEYAPEEGGRWSWTVRMREEL